ncbi:MAG: AraC family transcriptional regulator [Bacteroidota bacterium]
MNIWIVIFLCTAANGFFLSAALFLKGDRRAVWLAGFILTFALLISFYTLFWSGHLPSLPRIVRVAFGLTYLLGPLLYIYLMHPKGPNLWLQFLPFALYVGYFAIVPFLAKDAIWQSVQVLIQIGHILIYGLFILLVTRHKPLWQRTIAWAFAGYGLTYLFYYMLVWAGRIEIEHDYAISLAAAVLIYYVGLRGFRAPELAPMRTSKYEKSALGNTARIAILQQVKRFFHETRPFLDSDVSLQSISQSTGISRHHISEAINELEGINFPEFLTCYRLDEAQRILQDPMESKTKIIDVAYRSGFNNKVSFYQAFRKHLGMSPAAFREQCHLALSN